MWRVRRLVGLGIVGVMVGFGVDAVVTVPIRLMATVSLISFIVAVGIVDVFDGVLTNPVTVSIVPFACARQKNSQ